MTRFTPRGLALVLGGCLLGFAAAQLVPESRAAARPEPIKLGMPASSVVSYQGHPSKISYGPEHQVWYYADADGRVTARFWLNEGLVVRMSGD